MKLKDIVEIVANNDECVVLKVKDNQEMNLILLGCFQGNETMFRLTKGINVTCTIFRNNGNSVSWSWGYGGYTLVCDNLEKAGRMIQNCIEKDFYITCEQ